MTMTIKDFLASHPAGLTVEFKAEILNKESYPEAGMRAKIVNYAQCNHDDDVVSIEFDYSVFDELNKTFESSNYFDKNRVPCLNARQAGYYSPVETIYFDNSELVDSLFTVCSNNKVEIYQQYKDSGSSLTYVSWLESQLNIN